MKHVKIGPNNTLSCSTQPQIPLWLLGVIVFAVVWVEATAVGGIFEASVTEMGQESLVLAAAFLFGFTALRCPKQGSLLVLFAGLFGCMFIRELDAVFDLVFHGFWLYPALLLAAGMIVYAVYLPRMSFRQSRELLMTSPFKTVCFGLLTVLVISRIAGTGKLWDFILGSESSGHYYKNIIQEGLELWGYAIIAAGAWYVKSTLTETLRSEEKPQLILQMPTTSRHVAASDQMPTSSSWTGDIASRRAA